MRRAPGVTVTAVAVLALAMGASTAIFSVIEAVILRPLPYRDPAQLAVLWKSVPAKNTEWDWTSGPTVMDWRERNRSFEDMAIVLRPEAAHMRYVATAAAVPEKIQAAKVFGNFFELLGVPPQLGRTFTPEESLRGGRLAVLSHGFWERRFGADRSILGRTLDLDGSAITVIGVMPPDFQFPSQTTELWLPLADDPRWADWQQQRYRLADAFCALARLKPGVSMEQSRTDMNALSQRLAEEHPSTDAGLTVRVVPLFQQIVGAQVSRTLWTLVGAVLCVLLIACANAAGLLVVRGMAQQKELAVRAVLGAGRGRLLAYLATQNGLLFAGAAGAGWVVAAWTLPALLALAPEDLPRAAGIGVDRTAAAFALLLCLVTASVFGLLPALTAVRKERLTGFYDAGRGASSGLGAHSLRQWLAIFQFALAVTLLAGAGLLLRSFLLLNAVNPGFDESHLLTMLVELPDTKYSTPERIRVFLDDALERINAIPAVAGQAGVGSAHIGIFDGNVPNQNIVTEDQPLAPDPQRHDRDLVSDNFFRIMGIPLLEGRAFSAEDTRRSPSVALINQTMARRFWPFQNPVGKRFKEVLQGAEGGAWSTVIGVVGDVSRDRDGSVVPTFYWSIRQQAYRATELAIRTAGDPGRQVRAVAAAAHAVDTSLPEFNVSTVEQHVRDLDRPRRFQTWLIAIFAAIALLLAGAGLYGLMSYAVSQRTREIGIRMALGATPAKVTGLVLREGIVCACSGMALGLAGALVFGRVLSASLFGISAADPVTLSATAALLAVVTAAVCIFPVRRATGIDPVAALRQE